MPYGLYNKRKIFKAGRKALIDKIRWPSRKYGTAHVLRGSSDSVAAYGRDLASATDQQKAARKLVGWYGRGLYGGQGGYLKNLLGGLGGIAGKAVGYKNLGEMGGRALGSAAEGFIRGRGLYGGQGRYEGPAGKLDVSNALMNVEGAETSMTMHGQSDETDDVSFTLEEYIKPIYAPDFSTSSSSFNI